MILRKPYAFFIKYFKLIHVILALLVVFLIYRTGIVVNFLSDYLNSTSFIIEQEFVENLFFTYMIIVPIIVIILSGVILGIMYKKEKPILFYFINIVIFVVVLVLITYSRGFINGMTNNVMNIKAVKLTHDLLVISILLESFSFLIFLTRGLGLNFKKFDFSSDLININISDKDKEEVEININVDINEKKRKTKKNVRYLKYFYMENKFIINTIIIFLIIIIIFIVYYKLYIFKDYYKEGNAVNMDGVNIAVDQSYLLEETENFYLIGVDFKVNTTLKNKTLLNNDLFLKIGNYKILSTKEYCNNYVDLGDCYNGEIITNDFSNFLLFYEIPKIYYVNDILFEYVTVNNEVKFKINPIRLADNINIKKYKLDDILFFEESMLRNINFRISSFEISDSFSINYNYCYKENDCINSIEYIKPTINSNFDKTVLKLNLEYNSENKTYNTFYKLFEKYGSITYILNEIEYTQKLEFEELKSSKLKEQGIIYISAIRDILNADYISLEFNIRNNKYEYVLRGE